MRNHIVAYWRENNTVKPNLNTGKFLFAASEDLNKSIKTCLVQVLDVERGTLYPPRYMYMVLAQSGWANYDGDQSWAPLLLSKVKRDLWAEGTK